MRTRPLCYHAAAMLRSAFSYDLPADLIAQTPLPQRSASRLLCLDGHSGAVADRTFTDLPRLLRAGDVLVLNNTRVMRARLRGVKETGGRIEAMSERILAPDRLLAQVRASKPLRPGMRLHVGRGTELEVIARVGEFYELRLMGDRNVIDMLEDEGELPLPPYIDRAASAADDSRYQTVFAREVGAVAAPTAGLHFDDALLTAIQQQGVGIAHVTLHVGAGTFQPVRSERLEDHRMHRERLRVSPEVCEQLCRARESGGRIIAVGTTAVRSLEAASQDGVLRPFEGETELFIRPGYRFAAVDALITNFHLPESTLLMLVCAFGGYTSVMAAYQHAIRKRYRFFSYGDAMFILPHPAALRAR